jgi:hypothetical protein
MWPIDQVKRILGLDFSDQARREIAEDEDAAGRKTAARYSRGSVGIQKSAFQTRADLNRQLAKAGISPRPSEAQ